MIDSENFCNHCQHFHWTFKFHTWQLGSYLQSSLKDLLSLWATDGAVTCNLLVPLDTKRSHSVTSWRKKIKGAVRINSPSLSGNLEFYSFKLSHWKVKGWSTTWTLEYDVSTMLSRGNSLPNHISNLRTTQPRLDHIFLGKAYNGLTVQAWGPVVA